MRFILYLLTIISGTYMMVVGWNDIERLRINSIAFSIALLMFMCLLEYAMVILEQWKRQEGLRNSKQERRNLDKRSRQ